jgi:hypothetical protein
MNLLNDLNASAQLQTSVVPATATPAASDAAAATSVVSTGIAALFMQEVDQREAQMAQERQNAIDLNFQMAMEELNAGFAVRSDFLSTSFENSMSMLGSQTSDNSKDSDYDDDDDDDCNSPLNLTAFNQNIVL